MLKMQIAPDELLKTKGEEKKIALDQLLKATGEQPLRAGQTIEVGFQVACPFNGPLNPVATREMLKLQALEAEPPAR